MSNDLDYDLKDYSPSSVDEEVENIEGLIDAIDRANPDSQQNVEQRIIEGFNPNNKPDNLQFPVEQNQIPLTKSDEESTEFPVDGEPIIDQDIPDLQTGQIPFNTEKPVFPTDITLGITEQYEPPESQRNIFDPGNIWEGWELDENGKIPIEQLVAANKEWESGTKITESMINYHSLTTPVLELEEELERIFSNPLNTRQYAEAIRRANESPEFLAIHDRNKNGFLDFHDMFPKIRVGPDNNPIDPDEDPEGFIEQHKEFMKGLADPTLQERFFQALETYFIPHSNDNQVVYSIRQRQQTLLKNPPLGRGFGMNVEMGAINLSKNLLDWMGDEERADIFRSRLTVHPYQKRGFQDDYARSIGYYGPGISAGAVALFSGKALLVALGVTGAASIPIIGGTTLGKTGLAGAATYLSTSLLSELAQVGLPAWIWDPSPDSWNVHETESTFIQGLAKNYGFYENISVFGYNIGLKSWYENESTSRFANVIEETGLGMTFDSALQGLGWLIPKGAKVANNVINGFDMTQISKWKTAVTALNNLDLRTSRIPFFTTKTPGEFNFQAMLRRGQDRFTAARSQANRWLEGPASPWSSPNASINDLSSTFGGFKNNADPIQRVTPTRASVRDINNLSDMASEQVIDIPAGVPNALSPLELKELYKTGEIGTTLRRLVEDLADDPTFIDQIRSLPKKARTILGLNEGTLRRIQTLLSRDAATLKPSEFWADFITNQPLPTKGFKNLTPVEAFTFENLHVADALTESIVSRIRAIADAASHLNGKKDIFAIDGPMSRLKDNLVVGLTNIKRTKLLWNNVIQEGNIKELTDEILEQISKDVNAQSIRFHRESQEVTDAMFELLQDNSNMDVAEGILEVYRSIDKPTHLLDIDNWIRQRIRSGGFNLPKGEALKEVQGVYVNSILSGTRTPGRAGLGTATNAYWNALSQAAWATARSPFTNDIASRRIALAKLKGMFELIPESYKIFTRNIKNNFDADIRTIKSRYSDRTAVGDRQWEIYKTWVTHKGTPGDQAAFFIADTARTLNNNRLFSWSPRTLGAIDDTFKWLLTRARAKEKAFVQLMEEAGDSKIKINNELLQKAEDLEFKNYLNEDGTLNLTEDSWLRRQFEEVTLTSPLSGWARKLDSVLKDNPFLTPFYLFARTGINGLHLTAKNTPVLGAVLKESQDILKATRRDLPSLLKYGIDNERDLQSAKALILGRQALGTAVVSIASNKYLSGDLTGNGPADPQLRQQWINSGWKPNHIYFNGVGFDYSSLEPFNTILSAIADVGDNLELMGPSWGEQRLEAVAYVIGRGVTGKTYLNGLDQFLGFIQRPWEMDKVGADIMNNSIVLSGMRNDFGRFLNPYMKELNADIWSSLRNRNAATDALISPLTGAEQLPVKHDQLNGEPINNWNIIQRGFNTISPISIDIKHDSPGRDLLFQSGYDLNSVTYSYDGHSFQEFPVIRSYFQNAMGSVPITVDFKTFKNLEAALDYLAKDPNIIRSLEQMKADANDPTKVNLNPNTAYNHNVRIHNLFVQAKRKAWAVINKEDHPAYIKVQEMLNDNRLDERANRESLEATSPLLQLNNP